MRFYIFLFKCYWMLAWKWPFWVTTFCYNRNTRVSCVSSFYILSIAVCVQALREWIHYSFVISIWLRRWPSQKWEKDMPTQLSEAQSIKFTVEVNVMFASVILLKESFILEWAWQNGTEFIYITQSPEIQYEIHTVSQCDAVNSGYLHLSYIKGIIYFGMGMIEWNSITYILLIL